MTLRSPLFPIVLGLSLVLAGCGESASRLSLLEANYLAASGAKREAVAVYSRSAEKGSFRAYAEYGLGAVYLSLGEADPALGRFSAALAALEAQDGNEELVYRAHYDAGIAYYRGGRFEESAGEFRAALEASGDRAEAKRNLELALRAAGRRGGSGGAAKAPVGQAKASGPEPKTLFDYVREKEGEKWRSRQWKAETPKTLDY